MSRTLTIAATVLLASAMTPVHAQTSGPATAPEPQTRAQRSGFEETSRSEDVRAFIDALAARTSHVRVDSFGTSEDGRTLPLLVFGDPPAASPEAARASGKPVVFVMGNIHGGEVEGKEALLNLSRRLTQGDLQPLLKSAVWLFAPIYNADGNDAISMNNRPEQNGPIGGVGTRENAKGLDLNRDFMKVESAEARSLVGLMTRWDPAIFVDLHTTNGSYHGYHLTYSPELNPNADPRIIAFERESLLPALRQAMEARHGFRTYYYGNFEAPPPAAPGRPINEPGQPRVWRTFDHHPRFSTNYVGLRNRIGILSEAYSYLSFADRIRASEAFVEEIMRFAAGHAREITALVRQADGEVVNGRVQEAGIGFDNRALPEPVDILVGGVTSTINPRSGKPMRVVDETVVHPERMQDYGIFAATATRPMPAAYVVPASSSGLHTAVAAALRAHGIRVETLTAATRVKTDQFEVTEVRHAQRPFQGHRETSVAGQYASHEITVPAGSLVVRTNQPLGRLVFYLLEPESDDGLTTWNVLDAALAPGAPHPVMKVDKRQRLPTRPLQ